MNELQIESGDIFACYGSDRVSKTISIGTGSIFAPKRLKLGPSHVAIACQWMGSMYWVESTTMSATPCAIGGERVRGCQAHYPGQRIAEYTSEGGHVDHYRLTKIFELSGDESELMSHVLIRHFVLKSTGYDMGHVLLAGTRLFKASRLFPGADLDRVFCSELIAAVLQRIGRINHRNPTKFSPGTLMRELVRQGTYRFEKSYS